MKFEILKTTEFKEWYEGLDIHTKRIIDARLERIQNEGYFGKGETSVKRFDGLTELKWKSGLRVYSVERVGNVVALLGGNKNGQKKDIRKAKKLLAALE